ncbi:MAG: universal stress protein [Candidatus Dormibacteraceae bacterium]
MRGLAGRGDPLPDLLSSVNILVMFTNILVATDGSNHASTAVAQAIDIARTQGARLTVVSVWRQYASWEGLAPGAPIDNYFLDRLKKDAETALAEAKAQVPDGVAVESRLLEGSPADAILEEVNRGSYDLLVMGSRGLGSVGSLLMGSVSLRVLHHSRVPVLVARPRQEESTQAASAAASEGASGR